MLAIIDQLCITSEKKFFVVLYNYVIECIFDALIFKKILIYNFDVLQH